MKLKDIAMQVQTVAFLWPSPENYARYAAVCDEQVHPTWSAFVAANAPRVEALRARGLRVERVAFDPDEMAAWCRAQGGAVDPKNRAAYAAMLFLQRREGADDAP